MKASTVTPLVLRSAVFAAVCLLNSPALLAQSAAPADDAEQQNAARVSYPAEFFAQYNPNTVSDMLNWIPGINLVLNNRGGGGRGLGADENILINGERMAGKNNSGRSQLNRIPATEVEYIEIIRGSVGDLAVRSEGQIVNIVLRRELASDSLTTELGIDLDHHDKLRSGISATYTRQQGGLNYLLSFTGNPRYQLVESHELDVDANQVPVGAIRREEETDIFDIDVNGNINFALTPVDRVGFNAQYRKPDAPTYTTRVLTDLTSSPYDLDYERETNQDDDYNWEVGSNFEHRYSGGSIFRLLGISNEQKRGRFRERFVRDEPTDAELKDLVLNTNSIAQENIVRGSFTWRLDDGQNLELGAEAAQNILDSTLALGLASATGPATPATGNLPASPVDNANSRVEEIRYEPFLRHTWQISPTLNLESELIGEFSEIKQTGDASKKRNFQFLRPSLDLRKDLTSSLQVRGRVQKQVSQLDFGQFVASADANDDEQDTEAGNPELVQEETWHYEVNVEYRLPNDLGVLNLRAFYDDISNVIDRLDLRPNAATPLGATGNIGDASKKGLIIDTSTRLGFVGLPGAIVTTNLRVEDSSVTDPILDIDRRLQHHGRGNFRLGFRQDLTAHNFNYGFDYRYNFQDGDLRYDVNRLEISNRDPSLTVFVQKTTLHNVVVNLESQNVLEGENCRERRRYGVRISDPAPSLIEYNCTGTGRQYALKVSTTF